MKVALYMHGGSGNHGCEALVRTISSMCASIGETTLYSRRPKEDYQYIGKDKIRIIQCGIPLPKSTLVGIVTRIKSKFFKDNFAYVRPSYASLLKDANFETIALSIGGDNYCYDGVPNVLAILNKELNRCSAKTVLFGCSIEPSLLNDKNIVDDLSRYSLISARESITADALVEANVKTEIILAPDPAFTLPIKELMLPEGFSKDNTVGINISPMVLEYEEGKQVLYDAYCNLIEYLIQSTDMQIALIPHVVWKSTNDLEPIEELWKRYSSSKRVIRIGDHNAEELKGYISRCRFFVGARTHSTIAAYSTCVPTLAVGYSVKSRGIARDLFGTDENYVLGVNDIKNDMDLVDAFKWMEDYEDSIRMQLKTIMPEYIKRAYLPIERIQKICQ